LMGAKPEDDLDGRTIKESAVSGFPPPRDMSWQQKPLYALDEAEVIKLVPEALSAVFEGDGVDYAHLCRSAQLNFYMYA